MIQLCGQGTWVALLATVATLTSLNAEYILLRSGTVIKGSVVSQNRSRVVVRSEQRTLVIAKSRIRRISYTPIRPETLPVKAADRPADKSVKRTNARARPLPAGAVASRGSGRYGNGRLWRAAVLPGWGHAAQGRTRLAFGFGAAFFGTLAYAGNARSVARSAQHAYNQDVRQAFFLGAFGLHVLGLAQPESRTAVSSWGNLAALNLSMNQGAFPNVQKKAARANYALGLIGAVYVAQLVHAYWFGVAGQSGRTTAKGPDRQSPGSVSWSRVIFQAAPQIPERASASSATGLESLRIGWEYRW